MHCVLWILPDLERCEHAVDPSLKTQADARDVVLALHPGERHFEMETEVALRNWTRILCTWWLRPRRRFLKLIGKAYWTLTMSAKKNLP